MASRKNCGLQPSRRKQVIEFHQSCRQSMEHAMLSVQHTVCSIRSGSSQATMRRCSSRSSFTSTKVFQTSNPSFFRTGPGMSRMRNSTRRQNAGTKNFVIENSRQTRQRCQNSSEGDVLTLTKTSLRTIKLISAFAQTGHFKKSKNIFGDFFQKSLSTLTP